jgi:hypothetical protein
LSKAISKLIIPDHPYILFRKIDFFWYNQIFGIQWMLKISHFETYPMERIKIRTKCKTFEKCVCFDIISSWKYVGV